MPSGSTLVDDRYGVKIITRLDVPHLLGGGLYRKKGGSLNGRLVEMLTYVVFSSGEEKT